MLVQFVQLPGLLRLAVAQVLLLVQLALCDFVESLWQWAVRSLQCRRT